MSTTQNNTNNRTKRYNLDFENQVLEASKTEGAYAVRKNMGFQIRNFINGKKLLKSMV